MTTNVPTITDGIPLYASGDPKTAFRHSDSAKILRLYGRPRSLLSGSAKIEKSDKVGVLSRVLYMTPGLFCPASTAGCRAGCLGHTSGHMPMEGPTRCRDQRAAFYIEHNDLFIEHLKDEIGLLRQAALKDSARPAIRLNGTSDILWERTHPDVMVEFPDVQFYDYTKVYPRMFSLGSQWWPSNYHLTFSGDGSKPDVSRRVLDAGQNVAMVFWPQLPEQWWGYPVIDGDTHDARFLDPKPCIVGLRAKGVARVDLDGFVVRACPTCGDEADQMQLISEEDDTHRTTTHRCHQCGYEERSRWILPHALKKSPPRCTSGRDEPLQLRIAA